MAKNKHSTALFEVIHTSKKPPNSSPNGGIPTPKWWFKNKRSASDPANRVAPERKPSFFSRRSQPAPQPVMEPEPLRIPGEPSLALDKGAGEIKFKLSYAGVAAAAFVVIVVLAIVYVVAKRNGTPQMASGSEIVLPSSNDPATTGTGFLAAVAPATQTNDPAPSRQIHDHPPTAPAPAVPAIPGNVIRQVGLNYVIAQSWESKEIAAGACDALNKAGIACTVMRSPPSWAAAPGWYSVVGVKGFDHVQHNPELDEYKRTIEAVGVKFAGTKQFNRFTPLLYKWRDDSEKAQ